MLFKIKSIVRSVVEKEEEKPAEKTRHSSSERRSTSVSSRKINSK